MVPQLADLDRRHASSAMKKGVRQGALSLSVLLGSVNASCVNLRPPPAPLSAEVAGAAPTQVWSAKAGRRFTGQVVLRDGMLYGAGLDRKVYAVDLTGGAVRWSTRLSGLIAGGVVVSGDTVFVATSRPQGNVFALDRKTGARLWRSSSGPVDAPLALIGGILITETQGGDILGLDPASGTRRWHRRLGTARIAAVAGPSRSALVSTVDSLFLIGVEEGKVIRRRSSPGVVLSSWIDHAGALLAGTTDSQVVSLRPGDLGQNWAVRLDAPVLGSPAARGDTVFAVTRRGTLYRILTAGEPRAERIAALDWPVTSSVTLMDDELLLGGADGAIRALGPDGTERWRLQVWRPVELGPLPLADGLLAIGGEGDLHRYRQ
jgi:outer membrane protein assembly factor BamB